MERELNNEFEYGCTADDRFFEIIEEKNINVDYLHIRYEPLYGIHDDFYLLSK